MLDEHSGKVQGFQMHTHVSDPNSPKLVIALKLKGNDNFCYYCSLNCNQEDCIKILILMTPVGKL